MFMKKHLVTLSFISSLFLPSWAMAEIYGTVMVSKGDIKVTSAKTGKTENSKVGFKVYSGDSIVAGADSRAKIIMSDKNVLNISPDSKLVIERYENDPSKNSRNVELKVDYGKVRASVNESYDGEKNKFNVKTPTAVAGVRGTDFIAGFNPRTRATQVITFTGIVAVGSQGPNGSILNAVYVRPGQSTQMNAGAKPSEPVAVPKDNMNQMDTESDAEKAPSVPAPRAAGETASVDTNSDSTGEKPAEPTNSAKSDSTGSQERAPASVSPSASMVDAKDLDVSVSKEIKVVDTPKAPAPVMAPVLNTTPVPKTNTFIENAVKNQKSRVKVEICLPGRC